MANEVNSYILTAANGANLTATGQSAGLSLPKAGSSRRPFRVKALVTAVSGTTPTCGLKLQVSRDGGTTWLDRVFFPNLTSQTSDNITAVGEYYCQLEGDTASPSNSVSPAQVRVVYTIAGTTPSFSMEVSIVSAYPG